MLSFPYSVLVSISILLFSLLNLISDILFSVPSYHELTKPSSFIVSNLGICISMPSTKMDVWWSRECLWLRWTTPAWAISAGEVRRAFCGTANRSACSKAELRGQRTIGWKWRQRSKDCVRRPGLRSRGRRRFRLPPPWDDGVPATLAVQRVEGGVWKPGPQSGSVGRKLDELAGYHPVTWIHGGGHSGHADQERCDALAFESARQSRQDSAAEYWPWLPHPYVSSARLAIEWYRLNGP